MKIKLTRPQLELFLNKATVSGTKVRSLAMKGLIELGLYERIEYPSGAKECVITKKGERMRSHILKLTDAGLLTHHITTTESSKDEKGFELCNHGRMW